MDFTMPKTKNCYKGDHPPTYVGIDKSTKHAVEEYLTATKFDGFSAVEGDKKAMESSFAGELWTITNNMVRGRSWKKKDFEVKDGIIRYLSHNKLKKNFDLFQCSVRVCTGDDFEIQIPTDSFAFEINSSPNMEAPWKMELCAETSEDRDKWVKVIKQASITVSGAVRSS